MRLSQQGNNRGAVGAHVALRTDRRTLNRWAQAGDSYQSSSDARLLFALAHDEVPVELEVRWPGGPLLRLEAPPAGRYLTLHRP